MLTYNELSDAVEKLLKNAGGKLYKHIITDTYNNSKYTFEIINKTSDNLSSNDIIDYLKNIPEGNFLPVYASYITDVYNNGQFNIVNRISIGSNNYAIIEYQAIQYDATNQKLKIDNGTSTLWGGFSGISQYAIEI